MLFILLCLIRSILLINRFLSFFDFSSFTNMWFNNIISNNWKISIAIGGFAVGLASLAAIYNKLYNNKNCVADCDKSLELIPAYEKMLKELGIITHNMNINPIFLCGKKNNVFDLPTKMVIENYLESFVDDPFINIFSQSLMKSEVNTGLERAIKCLRDKNYEDVEEACKEELKKKKNKNAKKKSKRKIRRTLALNLLATFSILRGDYATAVEYLTTVIETPGAPKKLVINSLVKRSSVFYQRRQVKESLEDLQLAEDIVHEIKRLDAQIAIVMNDK